MAAKSSPLDNQPGDSAEGLTVSTAPLDGIYANVDASEGMVEEPILLTSEGASAKSSWSPAKLGLISLASVVILAVLLGSAWGLRRKAVAARQSSSRGDLPPRDANLVDVLRNELSSRHVEDLTLSYNVGELQVLSLKLPSYLRSRQAETARFVAEYFQKCRELHNVRIKSLALIRHYRPGQYIDELLAESLKEVSVKLEGVNKFLLGATARLEGGGFCKKEDTDEWRHILQGLKRYAEKSIDLCTRFSGSLNEPHRFDALRGEGRAALAELRQSLQRHRGVIPEGGATVLGADNFLP